MLRSPKELQLVLQLKNEEEVLKVFRA